MKTQSQLILKHLDAGHSITPIEALHSFGCFRLGARIYDIKQQGHNIETTTVKAGGKSFASYSLVKHKIIIPI